MMNTTVVLSCMGGEQGEIGVVRTLGRQGVPITVLSESEDTIVPRSRYCNKTIYMDNLSADYAKTLNILIDYAKKEDRKPVLFPTADPDLKLISDLREELEKYYYLIVTRKDLVDGFMDKRKFFDIADRHRFPIPGTFLPNSLEDVVTLSKKLRYPAIVKPSVPSAWTKRAVQEIVQHKKAVIVRSRDHLLDICTKLAAYSMDMIIQEYIGGSDDNHYDLHVYMNKKSEPIAFFTGRKTRIYPAYAGTGCFVESLYINDLVEQGLQMLKEVSFTGLANINYKRDPTTNDFKLLEINPRVSSWNILDARCGVNLPFIAYADAVGISFERPIKQRENVKYVYLESDFKAFLEYRRNGHWTLRTWLCSLRGKKVYQMFAIDDLMPFLVDMRKKMYALVKKLLRVCFVL